MTGDRALSYVRFLTGAALMYLGVTHMQQMWDTRELFDANPAWRAWPLVGDADSLKLTLWLALTEFFLGVFIFGGLLTRFLAPLASGVGLFQVLSLGAGAGWVAAAMLIGALIVSARGGGARTMDSSLGAMQLRSIERERVRAAERAARRGGSG